MTPLIFAWLSIFLVGIWRLHRHKTTHKPLLPPGPRGLPIIGNLHMLGSLPHHSLTEFSKKYGPIMSLRLGSVPAVVVSSAHSAELFLKTHDNIFASRPKAQAAEHLSYGNTAMVLRPYGAYWRNVRRFCSTELLSVKKIESFSGLRRDEVRYLVEDVKAAAAGEAVDLSEKVAGLTETLTCRMIFGRCKYDKVNLKSTIAEMFDLVGTFNVADYVPWLTPLDLQGLTRRMKKASKAFDKILEPIILEHEKNPNNDFSTQDDFIDIMLSMKNKSIEKNDNSLTINQSNMKAIVLDMIAGAIDTSDVSIEWVLSELIKNPRTMNQLQEELNNVVGPKNMVEETDLPNLNYLTMVIKEGLRLHPTPFLIPRESMEDIVIDDYFIPKKSQIFINSWAIGRDPNSWSDNANEFLPERFIGSNTDLRGHNFELLPFGSGRRGCPGIHLGLITVKLVVAQLVHCFDWKLPKELSPADLDMSEVFGPTVHRAKHLLVVPTYRLGAT